MSKDLIGYNTLVEDGLRSVVREALRRVAEEGWPGTHHAYITFKTAAPGVEVPDFLHTRYPDELTIVLQHQFWGLEVEDDSFSVTLSFNKVGHRIVVPFAALTSYADPSIKFGLQFGVAPEARGEVTAPEADEKPAKRKARGKKAEPEDRATGSVPAAGGERAPPEAEAEEDTDAPGSNGEKVVALDHFRKK
ncbi:MAG: ClpXP protease specificity-enhancing factor SspB [Rhodospirillales bacterium]|nr:ClpXP protease specificity-enhancing factor SspB [Rhodospirillales bacterium]